MVKIEDDSVVVTNFYRAMKLLIDFTIQSRFDGDICSQSIYLETEERQKNEVGAKAVRQDKLFFIIWQLNLKLESSHWKNEQFWEF